MQGRKMRCLGLLVLRIIRGLRSCLMGWLGSWRRLGLGGRGARLLLGMEGEKGRKGRINVVEIGYNQYYGMNGMVESGNDNDYYTKFYVIYKKIF